MTTEEKPRKTTRMRRLILLPLLALIALGSWALSSPVGSSPDDGFHLSSIWCAGGERADLCGEAATPDQREVAVDLVKAPCFGQNPSVSGECQGSDYGQNPDETEATIHGNFNGLYPPIFYGTMTMFASANLESAVIGMRIFNSALLVGLMTALFVLLPAHRRPALTWSVVITVVPLGMFLIPSTNPSSWAVTSAVTLFFSLLGYFETKGRKRIILGALAVLATLIGAGARADAAVYAGIAIVAVVILTAKFNREYLLSAVLPVLLVGLALLLYSTARQSSDAVGGMDFGEEEVLNPLALLMKNALLLPDLWYGAFGGWGLGWLDTEMPPLTAVASFAVFVAILFVGLGSTSTRKGLAAGVAFIAVTAVPLFILGQSSQTVGSLVQPRYLLPLLAMLAAIALLRDRDEPIRLSRGQFYMTATALALANGAALHTNIRRYVTGLDTFGWNLDDGAEWWWSIPVSPMLVWAIGTAAFAGVLLLLGPLLRHPPRDSTAKQNRALTLQD